MTTADPVACEALIAKLVPVIESEPEWLVRLGALTAILVSVYLQISPEEWTLERRIAEFEKMCRSYFSQVGGVGGVQ